MTIPIYVLPKRNERADSRLLLGIITVDAYQRDVVVLRRHPLEWETNDGGRVVTYTHFQQERPALCRKKVFSIIDRSTVGDKNLWKNSSVR